MENLTAALREAYATTRSDVVFLDTLEVQSGERRLYLVKDTVDSTLRTEDGVDRLFKASNFRVSLPAAGENGIQDLTVTFDNVDRQASDFVQESLRLREAVTIIYRPYLSDDPNTPQMVPPLTLFLSDVTITAFEVSGRATFADLLNRRFLSETYSKQRFPGL